MKLKEKFGKIFGKIGEKKLTKKSRKILCWYTKSYMSVKKSPTRREAEKSSKGNKLRKEFEKKI